MQTLITLNAFMMNKIIYLIKYTEIKNNLLCLKREMVNYLQYIINYFIYIYK